MSDDRSVFKSAEKEALGLAEIQIWLDEDTIILRESQMFKLDKQSKLAYCPVMHQNIGSPYDEKADRFWSRLYNKFEIPESALFPMITAAGKEKIRPYFNAGCLVTGLMRKWAEFYPQLYKDKVYVDMCNQDVTKRIFLHQAALTVAILKLIKKDEMVELPGSYNYPIFFDEMFGAPDKYDNIMDAVTIRYDFYFRNPAPHWNKKLKAPENIMKWLTQRLPHPKESEAGEPAK